MVKKGIITIIQIPIIFIFIPLYVLLIGYKFLFQKGRVIPNLVWAPIPIISNKYWSISMQKAGYKSITVMEHYYSNINNLNDYDYLFSDFFFKFNNIRIRKFLNYITPYFVLLRLVLSTDIIHFPFSGGILFRTSLRRLEPYLYKLANIKCVVIPYGADFYQYSKIVDNCLKHALLISYPSFAKMEKEIDSNIRRWVIHADCIVGGFHIDGLGRWDILPFVPFIIDTDQWKIKSHYSLSDGINGEVSILHCSNHNGFKGTEFIQNAINILLERGYKINFKILQNVPNSEVYQIMSESDILVEQLIANAYSLNAIEGMSTGLPVIANIKDGPYFNLFKAYSFAEECPVVSANLFNLVDVLESLISNPILRKEIGVKSRAYVEKFHSFESSHFLFSNIYKKVWKNENVDLINLYHPLKSLI